MVHCVLRRNFFQKYPPFHGDPAHWNGVVSRQTLLERQGEANRSCSARPSGQCQQVAFAHAAEQITTQETSNSEIICCVFLASALARVITFPYWAQVLDNIALVVLEEMAPGSREWYTWRDVLHLVDIACCCAILFPIVWSIRHLRQAAAAGATMLVASHELERAGSLATRTVDVVAGRVHEVPGDPGSGNQAVTGPEDGR